MVDPEVRAYVKELNEEGELWERAFDIAQRYLPELSNGSPFDDFRIVWSTQLTWSWGYHRCEWRYFTITSESAYKAGTHNHRITITHRLLEYPEWVQDAVILHEMSHCLIPNHGAEFWALQARYPQAKAACNGLGLKFRDVI